MYAEKGKGGRSKRRPAGKRVGGGGRQNDRCLSEVKPSGIRFYIIGV